MHRVGAAPSDVPALVAAIAAETPRLRLAGIFTHLAVADEPGDAYTGQQLARLDEVIAALPDLDGVAVHAANSAGALCPPGRTAVVRPCRHRRLRGVARAGCRRARRRPPPRPLTAGEGVVRQAPGRRPRELSYGLRHQLAADANVATVPLGYADGVRRGLSSNGDVLIGGRRRPIIGTITMDQLMVDCGDDPVQRGDEVVLLGRQGDESITAEEWATRLATIGYEVLCGIGPRVPRHVVARRP